MDNLVLLVMVNRAIKNIVDQNRVSSLFRETFTGEMLNAIAMFTCKLFYIGGLLLTLLLKS